MYIHLYNNNTTEFITFLNRMYSPTIVASIIITRNVASFPDYSIKYFLSFLNTNHVSGYIMIFIIMEAFCSHHLFTHFLTNVLLHALQHKLLHFTHRLPTHTQTSSLCSKNYLGVCMSLVPVTMTDPGR